MSKNFFDYPTSETNFPSNFFFLLKNFSLTIFEGIDFVIVIDHSASMKLNNKLAFVLATIEYLINKLNDHHRFCLIKFNQEVSLVTNGLLSMNDENKDRVRSLLHDIKPQGKTPELPQTTRWRFE